MSRKTVHSPHTRNGSSRTISGLVASMTAEQGCIPMRATWRCQSLHLRRQESRRERSICPARYKNLGYSTTFSIGSRRRYSSRLRWPFSRFTSLPVTAVSSSISPALTGHRLRLEKSKTQCDHARLTNRATRVMAKVRSRETKLYWAL